MRLISKTAFTLVTLLSGPLSFAGGWSNTETVTTVFPHGGNDVVYIEQLQMVNPDGCGSSDLYVLKKDNPLFDQIYALVLSTRVSELSARFYVDGCFNQRPVVMYAQL